MARLTESSIIRRESTDLQRRSPMRFARLGHLGEETPVVWHEDQAFDLRSITPDIDGRFLSSDPVAATTRALADGTLPVIPDAETRRTGAPIVRPSAVY